MSAPAIVGAGGYVMPPCLMSSVVSEKGRSKPMTSTTPRAIRDKPRRAGRKRWDANHGVAARNASPDGVTTTKTGPRSSQMFHGLSKMNLPGYLGFFQFLRNYRQLTAFEQAELILYAALDPTIASRTQQGAFVRCLDHFDLLQTAIN